MELVKAKLRGQLRQRHQAVGGSELSIEGIPFPETRAYVEDVLDKQRAYREKYATELGY